MRKSKKDFGKIMDELAAAKKAEANARVDAFRSRLEVGSVPGTSAKDKYLYFIGCGDAVKVGVSSDPNSRMETLATGAPGKLFLIACIPNMGHKENEVHKKLAHLQIHREWFRYTNEVHELIKELS